MKDRFFWLALCVIVMSWVANLTYANSKQLDEPIFLDHYVETALQDNLLLTFYYLTNLNDSSSISHVNINGVTGYIAQDDFSSDFGFNTYVEDNPNMQSFTHYALRNIHVELNPFELEDYSVNGIFSFSDIELFFTDGTNTTVPIGEVIIQEAYQDNNILEDVSGSSGGYWSNSVYQTKEALVIEDITINHGDALKDQLFVKIDATNQSSTDNTFNPDKVPGTDIQNIELPYELEKDEFFYIYTQIAPEFIGFTEALIKFSGTTKSGKTFTSSSWFTSQQPYLEQKDVNAIILKKSKGGSQ